MCLGSARLQQRVEVQRSRRVLALALALAQGRTWRLRRRKLRWGRLGR